MTRSHSFEQSESRILTILVGYDIWIDVIDRLLGLGMYWSCCTRIRRIAHDGSVLWTSGAAVRVLPVESRQDPSYGQGQKGRCCREAQQQRAQHWRVRVPCHGTNGKRSINRNFHRATYLLCLPLFSPCTPDYCRKYVYFYATYTTIPSSVHIAEHCELFDHRFSFADIRLNL